MTASTRLRTASNCLEIARQWEQDESGVYSLGTRYRKSLTALLAAYNIYTEAVDSGEVKVLAVDMPRLRREIQLTAVLLGGETTSH